jgi:hypothetical protein
LQLFQQECTSRLLISMSKSIYDFRNFSYKVIWKRTLYVTHEFNLSENKLKPLSPYNINKMHFIGAPLEILKFLRFKLKLCRTLQNNAITAIKYL